jgi:hypothetical protein
MPTEVNKTRKSAKKATQKPTAKSTQKRPAPLTRNATKKRNLKAVPPRFDLGIKSASFGTEHAEITKVQKYLTRFGYLNSVITPGKLDDATSEALKLFQQVAGVGITGELNAKTTAAMQMYRCGTPDLGVVMRIKGGESSNFVLRGCSYNKTAFTYRFANGTNDITGTQERIAIRNAFNTWASVLCGVSFHERTIAPTDFVIGWFSGNHGDGSPFDGVGNTLAHAFYPPPCGGNHAGEMHFDEAESWSLTGAGSTFDTETVALHEIGHLLGLDHSSVAGSVMFPSYGGVRRSLTQDDIEGIRRLYPVLCRQGDSGALAGFASEIAASRLNQKQVITAVRAQDGALKLIAWNVAANGAFTRTGDSGGQAGAATNLAIARATSGFRFVTACRNGSNRLFLISWEVNNSGTSITRLADSGTLAGTASMIKIVAAGNNRFVTACRAGNGSLLLISWQLSANGAFTRIADSGNQAGEILDVDMVATSNNRIITAVRQAGGDLKLISWNVTNGSITRLADSATQAGNARFVKTALDQFGHVITAVKAANNSLKLISWSVGGGGQVTRLSDSGDLAGETGEHDISLAAGRIVTGVRTGNGNLKVILWQVTSNGNITRVGDSASLAGDASLITQCEQLTGAPPIITCVRAANNSLKLIAWSAV